MKLLAGVVLFLLCALAGEGKARRLKRREQLLSDLHALIRQIGDGQQSALLSFREATLRCPSSPEREQLLRLSGGEAASLPLLSAEEAACLKAYARSDSRSVSALRAERESLLDMLARGRDLARAELTGKGQVYRTVGYLSGLAALLLVL